MNAHVSKPVEMKVLEKTIRSIKSGGGGTEPQVTEQDKWIWCGSAILLKQEVNKEMYREIYLTDRQEI